MAQNIFEYMLRNHTIEHYDVTRGVALNTYITSQAYWLALNEVKDLIHYSNHEHSVDNYDWLDRHPIFPHPTDEYHDPYLTEVLQDCVTQLQTQYPSKRTKDYASLLTSLVEQAQLDDDINLSYIARKLGISRQAVSLQFTALKELPPVQQFFERVKEYTVQDA